jgi:BirA family biotin operon repressor/biotin-[acetyl-CoA-carboxylase] ligase
MSRQFTYVPVVTSTSDVAKRLAEEGCGEGTVVAADFQTEGRGRLGRRWEAPPGSSLLLSFVFRPSLRPHEAQRVTMLCALAVTDAVEQETGLKAGLKWPNDIVFEGAKLGGILAEASLRGESLAYLVVGLGLNVNLDPDQLCEGPVVPVTSLSRAVGRRVRRLPLMCSLLYAVETRYGALQRGWSPRDEWAARLTTLGRPVKVSGSGHPIEGIAAGVDEDGALLVQRVDGRMERVLAGDVTLRTGPGWHEATRSATMPCQVVNNRRGPGDPGKVCI